MSREKPEGLPRFRSFIRVPPCSVVSQMYVVSIGNGPSAVRITKRSLGMNSTISNERTHELDILFATESSNLLLNVFHSSCHKTSPPFGISHESSAVSARSLTANNEPRRHDTSKRACDSRSSRSQVRCNRHHILDGKIGHRALHELRCRASACAVLDVIELAHDIAR